MEEEVTVEEGEGKVLVWMINIKATTHTQKSKNDSSTLLYRSWLREMYC